MIKSIIYSLLFVSIYSFGQVDYRFKNYTINEGLSQSSVTCIVQDDQYSLWVGTQDGLNRYNGKEFTVINSDNTPSLLSEYFKCATKAKDGNIYFGTSNGLVVYKTLEDTLSVFSPNKKSVFEVSAIEPGLKGLVWIATPDKGLFSFNLSKKTFKNYANTSLPKNIDQILSMDDDRIIIASRDKGLGVFSISKHTWNKIDISFDTRVNKINKIVKIDKENVVVATLNGVFSINLKTGKTEKKFRNQIDKFETLNVNDISFNNKSGWFLATQNDGLYSIDINGNVQHSRADIFQKNALLIDELNVIYLDASGVYWVGSQRGLSSFDAEYKGILGIGASGNLTRGLPAASVWSFNESPGGEYLYIGSDVGISRLNRSTGIFEQFLRPKKENEHVGEKTILHIELISNDRILAGCTDGLFEVLISNGKSVYKEIKLSNDPLYKHKRVYKIVHWKDHKYFIATQDGVILYDINKGVDQVFQNEEGNLETITKGVCRLAFKSPDGNIYFATSSGGLSILEDKSGELIVKPYRFNKEILSKSKDLITSIFVDSKGVFWMGTAGSGLLKLNQNSGEVNQISKKNGLPNNVIYGVLGDSKGNIWMSTNKGLCAYNKNSENVRVYTDLDGLMGKEFNLGAYMSSEKGTMFFGGIYGCNYFNPLEFQKEQKNIDVVLSGLQVNGKWIKPSKDNTILLQPIFKSETIELGYNQRSFTIKFQPTVINESELVNYKYVLEGSEQGEVLLGTTNEIHFNALSHGSYKLKIYARKGNGAWSTTPAEINIIIEAPFWAKWWFWALVLLSIVVIGRIIIKRRVDTARRDQVKLEIKISQRTKEINKQKIKIENQKLKIEAERNKVIKQQEQLKIEKEKSEKLLRNVIPESTAKELIKKGKARARAYKTVSVLFTDFVGFTHISDRLSPTELVRKLDVYFTKFDEIIVANNLEKIKTIGDAYMCAGGVPVRNNTNPIDTCLAAIQIQHYMDQRMHEAIANNDEYWTLRLGINTGEVTAGVIGSERLAYDIWGATVNQAQRMEMLGEPGKVTITGATHTMIEPYFDCTFKGKAQSKSRGIIDMYVVDGIKPELSEEGKGLYPNQRFHQIVNLHHYSSINYYKAERHIMRVLESQLTKDLYYHSIEHTKDVVKAVEHIALLENVTDEGLFLLKSAATYHDAGFVEQYDNNEEIGARLADEILPKYGYTKAHIEKIKELIYVTEIPHKPKNKLEEIICDADLDYLGRDDFNEISDRLRRELIEHGKVESNKHWDEIQVSFLTSHQYFTDTAKETRNKKKQENLQSVIDRLKRDEY